MGPLALVHRTQRRSKRLDRVAMNEYCIKCLNINVSTIIRCVPYSNIPYSNDLILQLNNTLKYVSENSDQSFGKAIACIGHLHKVVYFMQIHIRRPASQLAAPYPSSTAWPEWLLSIENEWDPAT